MTTLSATSIAEPNQSIFHHGLFGNPKQWIAICTFALTIIGLLLVYSASAPVAWHRFGSPTALLEKQALFAMGGVLVFLFFARMDYHRLGKRSNWLYGLSILLLCALFIPGVGRRINGALRWIQAGGLTFQPVDLVKVILPLVLAWRLARHDRGQLGNGEPQSPKTTSMEIPQASSFWKSFVPPLILFLIPFGLVIIQPDMGNAILLMVTFLAMLFVAGLPLKHLMTCAIPVVPAIIGLVLYKGTYIKLRILEWWDALGSTELVDTAKTYQVNMSLRALAEGGWAGKGLGAGELKVFYLPEAYNDFILAVAGEELGYIGMLGILFLLGMLILQGMRLSRHAPDAYGRHLAFGLTFILSVQALMNLAVVTRSMPTKGISFPLLSAGGSSLVLSLCALGILYNIASQTRIPIAPVECGARPVKTKTKTKSKSKSKGKRK